MAFPSIILANIPGLDTRNSRDKRTDVENSRLVAITPVSLNNAHCQRVEGCALIGTEEAFVYKHILCTELSAANWKYVL